MPLFCDCARHQSTYNILYSHFTTLLLIIINNSHLVCQRPPGQMVSHADTIVVNINNNRRFIVAHVHLCQAATNVEMAPLVGHTPSIVVSRRLLQMLQCPKCLFPILFNLISK